MKMDSQTIAANSEAAILARLIQMRQDNLSQGAAEYLLSIQFDDRDVDRMNTLAQLARSGDLSEEDSAELDSSLHVSNLLAVMQSKARRSLAALSSNRDWPPKLFVKSGNVPTANVSTASSLPLCIRRPFR